MNRPQESNHSKTEWAARRLFYRVFTFSLLAGFLLHAPAAAAEQKHQKLIYDIYAGGFHVVRSEVNIDFSKKGRYSIFLGAFTRGFLANLAPWNGTFESHGWVVGEQDLRPELHKSVATWRDEDEIKEYYYSRDKGFQKLILTDHETPTHEPEIPKELTEGTTDALTAALHVFDAVSRGEPCAGSMDIFDGKRRFTQSFKEVQQTNLESTKYNVYEGPAVECIVEVAPVAGKWHDKPRGWMSIQEQGRNKGTMPTVWLANMSENNVAVPVKMRVKTDYGTLFMHLVEYHNNGEVILAEKQADLED